MRAGRLDRRITLRQPTEGRSATGGFEETWTDIATVWAQRKGQSGREFMAADTDAAERKAVFVIRWRADVCTTWRVLFEDIEWDIEATHEIGRRRGLELHCRRAG